MSVTAMARHRRRNRVNDQHPGVDVRKAVDAAYEVLHSRNQWDMDRLLLAIVERVASTVADDVERFERDLAAAKAQANPPTAQLSAADIKKIRERFLDALIEQAYAETKSGRVGFYDHEIRRAGEWLEELR